MISKIEKYYIICDSCQKSDITIDVLDGYVQLPENWSRVKVMNHFYLHSKIEIFCAACVVEAKKSSLHRDVDVLNESSFYHHEK